MHIIDAKSRYLIQNFKIKGKYVLEAHQHRRVSLSIIFFDSRILFFISLLWPESRSEESASTVYAVSYELRAEGSWTASGCSRPQAAATMASKTVETIDLLLLPTFYRAVPSECHLYGANDNS